MSRTIFETALLPGRSYLYSGSSEELFSSFEPVDILVFDALESDAKSARQLVVQAQLGAFGSRRLLLVANAHQMSEIVQNTLLKLLEEPPSTLTIVLQTDQASRLLPTVLSRLHLLGQKERARLAEQSRFERPFLELWGELAELTRDQLVNLLSLEMSYQQRQLLSNPCRQFADRVALLDRATKKINANANLKLTVDWLLLRWGGSSGYSERLVRELYKAYPADYTKD